MSLRHHDVLPIGQVATGSLLWRSHGRLHLTVIVKASYGLKPGGIMRQVEPAPLNEDEVHFDRRPTRSVRLASDDVPYLPKTDVLFSGSVWSPAKLPIPFTKVRLAVHGDDSLVDKTLHVHGDRQQSPTGLTAPQPFTELPLVYERAVRDPDGSENPVGVDPKSAGPLPNIVHPNDPERVVGFGPISRYWRTRRDRISPRSRALLGRPIMEIADAFDWSYFQAAPPDQRCRHVRGDEWVVVEGMDPKICAVHSRLPGGTAVACVWPANRQASSSYPVQMNADTLFIDGEARTCTITWRGSFPIAQQEVLEAIYIAAGVHYATDPIDWPAAKVAVARSRPRPDCAVLVAVDMVGTLTAVEHERREVEPSSGPGDLTSILLSSGDLIEVVEPPPSSAVSLDPADLEEVIEQAATDHEDAPPPKEADDLLATVHFEPTAASASLSDELADARADEPLGQTIVSAPEGDDLLQQTMALDQRSVVEAATAEDPLLQTIGLAEDSTVGPATPWEPLGRATEPAPSEKEGQPDPVVEPAAAGDSRAASEKEPDVLGTTLGLAEPALGSTLDLVGAPPTSVGAPFSLAQGSGDPVVLRPAAIPGAPWCDEEVQPVLPPSGDPMAETHQLDPALAAAVKATPAGAGTSERPAPSGPADQGAERASALRSQLLERLRLGQSANDLDLSGADLSGLDLTGCRLAGGSLEGANLRETSLVKADLSGAELASADLTDACLDGANLDDANLHGSVLRRASLKGVTLHRADLGEVEGSGANLERAAGYEANFAQGNWVGTRFFDAQIDQADFRKAVLDRAVFDSAALRQARLDDVRAIDVTAIGANLFEVSARRAVLLHCDFSKVAAQGSRWQDAILDDSSFREATLEEASLAGASCQRVDLSRANLRRAVLAGARLDQASFRHARLSESSLAGLDLSTVDLTGADLDD